MTFMESGSSFFVVAVQGCVITNMVLGHVRGLVQAVKISLLVQHRRGFSPQCRQVGCRATDLVLIQISSTFTLLLMYILLSGRSLCKRKNSPL